MCTGAAAALKVLTLQGNAITSVNPSWFMGVPAALEPILSPNPLTCQLAACAARQCSVSISKRLGCSTCSLGYVFNPLNSTCEFPPFGPDEQWNATQQRSDFGSNSTLFLGRSYSADAPPLSPAHSRFVGYAGGRFNEITYRLDVAGAVDVECGSVVVGNTKDSARYQDTRRYTNPRYDSSNAQVMARSTSTTHPTPRLVLKFSVPGM